MKLNFRVKFSFSLFLILIASGITAIDQVKAQELAKESLSVKTNEVRTGTRVIISTSAPAEFKSYCLDNPPRLIVEFKTRNVTSEIDNDIVVNQSVIKNIKRSYFKKGQGKSLKSLIFELAKKADYKIWQENNTIILDIYDPLKADSLTEGKQLEPFVSTMDSRQIFPAGSTEEAVIKRLEVIDTILTQETGSCLFLDEPITESLSPVETSQAEAFNEDEEKDIFSKGTPLLLPRLPDVKRSVVGRLFWFLSLTLICGLVFFVWRRGKKNREKKLRKFELALQEKDKLIKKEKFLRKVIEEAMLENEKEYKQLKNDYDAFKAEIIKKVSIDTELSPQEEESSTITEKLQERRISPRLFLTTDFSKTIILRIESRKTAQHAKCFVKDISLGGLCFVTTRKFEENGTINLRLFFYGEQIPMIKIQARVIWEKTEVPNNYYGVSFDLLGDKDRLELNHYIESKINEPVIEKS